MSRPILLVFLKPPRPGIVKTRLARSLGEADAAGLYRVLAEEVVRRTQPAGADYDRRFYYAPQDARAEAEAWLPNEDWRAQEGEDLGERLKTAFAAAFAEGRKRVVAIGGDTPWLGHARIREAFAALDRHDVALGPARDGGYYLIGLRTEHPELFADVPWGTSGVLEATLRHASSSGLTVRRLPALADIDTVDDIRNSWPPLRALLDVLGEHALASRIAISLGYRT